MQQQQAAQAISLYYEIMRSGPGRAEEHRSRETEDAATQRRLTETFRLRLRVRDAVTRRSNTDRRPLTAALRPLHKKRLSNRLIMQFLPQTLRNLQQEFHGSRFTRSKDPDSLSSADVKEFLTFLAVKRKVSASTQNQAFNALLFLYRHVLNREFGRIEGVVRARRKPYFPVVLSREEIEAILQHLTPPYDLVVKLLYGCGLRLSECLNLRAQCFNFDAGVLTIHDGKGGKDRTVPLPETIMPELRAQLERLKDLHRQDMGRDYAGVRVQN